MGVQGFVAAHPFFQFAYHFIIVGDRVCEILAGINKAFVRNNSIKFFNFDIAAVELLFQDCKQLVF